MVKQLKVTSTHWTQRLSSWLLHNQANITAVTTPRTSNQGQYRSKTPASAIFLAGGAIVAGELVSGGKIVCACCSATGAGFMTDGWC